MRIAVKLNQEDLWTMRGLVQKCGWGKFMDHVAGIMVEQADKVVPRSKQDKALFACSNTLLSLNKFFQDCGEFNYLVDGLPIPDEFRAILEKYKP
jgi:hypothetical protein